MREAKGMGGCYERKYSGLSKLIPFEMGLQIRCGVYPEEEAESDVWAGKTLFDRNLSCLWFGRRSARFWKVI